MPEEFVNIGNPNIKRFAAPGMVLGKTKYGSDINLPAMLYIRFLGSPHAHANIVSIDTSKAVALPGVKLVLTSKDVPTYRFHAPKDKPILAVEKVRFVGDEVAAVVAEDEDTAEEALELIDVKYEPLPFILDPEEAVKPDAPKIHAAGNVFQTVSIKRGDVAKGFAEADTIVEDRLYVPFYQHSCQETRSCAAIWEKDFLTMWGTSQWPHDSRNAVAAALGIPQSRVRFIGSCSGGGFGNSSAEQWQAATAYAAMKTGRPVKMVLPRSDEYTMTTHRYPIIVPSIKVGAKKDGTITALQMTAIADVGAYAHNPGPLGDGLFPILHGWVISNLLVSGNGVYTNKGECGYLRDVGNYQGTFIGNAVMMDLAKKLDVDPLAFILKNLMKKDVGIDQDAKTPYTSCPQPDVAQEAAKAFGWSETWKGWGTPTGVVGSKRRGIGLALGASSKGRIRPPMSGIVIVNTDGTLQVLTGSADTGTGTGSTALPIIAAEEFGVGFEAVRVTWGDTAVTQDTGMQNGSTMVRSGGMGILMAARDAKNQLFQLAAPKLGVKPEDLEAKGGRIYVKATPEKGLTIKEVASTAPAPIIGRGNYTVPPGYSQAHFHTAMAEVEVDTDTGEVTVLRYVAGHGLGRVIFRLGAENQVDGCVVNGLEHAMFGVLLFDTLTGIPINANYLDYKLPTVLDAPRKIVPVFVEQNDPIAPFGAIGLGEPPNEGPGAAVRNAILHATGVSIMDLPLYPEKILKALGKVR